MRSKKNSIIKTDYLKEQKFKIMEKLKFRTQYNKNEFPTDHEVNDLPSETVPNEALSARTILERYSRGIPITEGNRIPIWYDDKELKENLEIMNVPDLDKLDLSERMDLLESQREKVAEIKETIRRRKKEQERKDQESKKKETSPESKPIVTPEKETKPDNETK